LKNSKDSPGDSIFILNYITDKEIIPVGPKDSVFHVLRLLLRKGMCVPIYNYLLFLLIAISLLPPVSFLNFPCQPFKNLIYF
jgi:hypothetical protein